MMHPARNSSLHVRTGTRPPPSPGIFPGPGQRGDVTDPDIPSTQFLKVGLEELAARRAELYTLSRNILEESGKKRGWSDGWDPDTMRSTCFPPMADSSANPTTPGAGGPDGKGDTLFFGSAHSGVFNASFADGSVQSLTYEIDPQMFDYMGDRRDGQIVSTQ